MLCWKKNKELQTSSHSFNPPLPWIARIARNTRIGRMPTTIHINVDKKNSAIHANDNKWHYSNNSCPVRHKLLANCTKKKSRRKNKNRSAEIYTLGNREAEEKERAPAPPPRARQRGSWHPRDWDEKPSRTSIPLATNFACAAWWRPRAARARASTLLPCMVPYSPLPLLLTLPKLKTLQIQQNTTNCTSPHHISHQRIRHFVPPIECHKFSGPDSQHGDVETEYRSVANCRNHFGEQGNLQGATSTKP